jgi:hypothetical protein
LESCLHKASAEGRETACGVGAAGGQKLLDLLAKDPFSKPPPFEKLVGDLAAAYPRRITPCLIAQEIIAGFSGAGSFIAVVSKIPCS